MLYNYSTTEIVKNLLTLSHRNSNQKSNVRFDLLVCDKDKRFARMSARPPPPPRKPASGSTLTSAPPPIAPHPLAGASAPPPAVLGPPPRPAVVGPPPPPTGQILTTERRASGMIGQSRATPTNSSPLIQPAAPNRGRPKIPGSTPPQQQKPTNNMFIVELPPIDQSPWSPLLNLVLRETEIVTKAIITSCAPPEKDLIAHALVNIYASAGRIFGLITPIIEDQVETTEAAGTLFRGNCLATKAITSYSVTIGKPYVKEIFEGPIQNIINGGLSYEINPLKVSEAEVRVNLENLKDAVHSFMSAILNSLSYCPLVIRKLCYDLRVAVVSKFPESLYTVVGGFFFLRFLVPTIVSPEGFGIINVPDEARRPLVLISKVVQNLGNGVEFGKKEEYMEPLNDLILYYLPIVQQFFDELSELPSEHIDMPPVAINDQIMQKFHKQMHYSYDKILETISAYETAYNLPKGSETSEFKNVLAAMGTPALLADQKKDKKKDKKKK